MTADGETPIRSSALNLLIGWAKDNLGRWWDRFPKRDEFSEQENNNGNDKIGEKVSPALTKLFMGSARQNAKFF